MGEYTKLVEQILEEGIVRKTKRAIKKDSLQDYMKDLSLLTKNGWVLDSQNSDLRGDFSGLMKIALSNKQYKYASLAVMFENDSPTTLTTFWTNKGASSEHSSTKLNGKLTNKDLKWAKEECYFIEKTFYKV